MLDLHEKYVRSRPELIEYIKKECTGKTLGCFCKPKRCHGDLYVAICEELTILDKMEN